jgi:septal ring factor EnvC (AmiA/AmiB activator)
VSGTKENPPPITEPTKRAGHEIEKGWPHLIAAWPASLSLVFISALLGFLLAWYMVVASKNATIETLTTASKEKDTKIDQLQKENEKLQRQNAESKTALAEFVAPLKKRTLILASQLTEFAQQHQTNNPPSQTFIDFKNRFETRLFTIESQLDEAGEHSDLLNNALQSLYYNAYNPLFTTNLLIATRELERLANNLKE